MQAPNDNCNELVYQPSRTYAHSDTRQPEIRVLSTHAHVT